MPLSFRDARPVRMTIERRALQGTAIGIVSFVANVIQTIVAVPLLIRAWGAEQYGAWIALQALLALVTTLEGGHAENVGNEAQQVYHSDRSRLAEVVGSGVVVSLLLAAVELAIAVTLAIRGTAQSHLGLDATSPLARQAALGLVILTLPSLLVTAPNGILGRLFLPSGNYVRFSMWGIVCRLAVAVAPLAAAACGLGIVWAASLVALATVVTQWPSAIGGARSVGLDMRIFAAARFAAGVAGLKRSLVRTGVGYLAQAQLSWLTLLLVPIVGASALAGFTTTRTVTSIFAQASTIIAAPLGPELIRFHATADRYRRNTTFQAMWFVGGGIVNLSVVGLLPFIATGYRFWTHGMLWFDPVVFAALMLSISVRVFGAPLAAYFNGINHMRCVTASAVAQGALTLGVAALTVGRWGVRGASLGVLMGEIAGSLCVPAFVMLRENRREGGSPMAGQMFQALVPTSIVAVALGLAASGAASLTVVGPVAFGLVGLAYGIQWRALPEDLRLRGHRAIEHYLPARWRRR